MNTADQGYYIQGYDNSSNHGYSYFNTRGYYLSWNNNKLNS